MACLRRRNAEAEVAGGGLEDCFQATDGLVANGGDDAPDEEIDIRSTL